MLREHYSQGRGARMLVSQTDLLDSVRAAIEARCGGDASQRSAIFSPSKRVFVEAPAGYGKTTVMTGRACWLLASGEVQPPKRILALTFSVAAARRMRTDLSATMSALPGPVDKRFEDSVMVTNFPRLCLGSAAQILEIALAPSKR